MKIVVTGGAGFLGSHLVDRLVMRGHDVIVIDHHAKEKLRFPNEKAAVHRMDIADPRIAGILASEAPDAVVHLAAQISVTRSIAAPHEDATQNIVHALQFMEWARQAGVRKSVFSSSGGAIYGDHPERPTPLLVHAAPRSPYGINKLAFEGYLEHFFQTHGMKSVSLRFANLYGPRQQVVRPLGEGNVVSLFLHRLLVTGEPLTVFGDGSTSRDYVYVDDAVDALVQAIEGDVSATVNIGTGRETTVNDLMASLFAIHGKPHPVEFAPLRAGEVMHSVLDPRSAKEVLDWEAKTPLDKGLKATYDWYKSTFGKGV